MDIVIRSASAGKHKTRLNNFRKMLRRLSMNRRQFLAGSLVSGISSSIILPPRSVAIEDRNTSPAVDYRLTLQTPARRFDGKESFCHPRAGIVPGVGKDGGPRVVMTMLTLDL